MSGGWDATQKVGHVPPYVERELKTGDQDALVKFPGAITQGMCPCARSEPIALDTLHHVHLCRH